MKKSVKEKTSSHQGVVGEEIYRSIKREREGGKRERERRETSREDEERKQKRN